jgi:ketosteroid isomerase-like protein
MPADDFQQFVDQVKAATSQYVMGNATPFKELWSHADDVTIFGGFGAYEQGWDEVGPRLDWAASRIREGKEIIEPLAMGMSGDLAYTVWLENGEVRYAGREELSPRVLRVTHIYRREDGTWKIIHRHADAITEKIGPTAAPQR